MTRLLNVLRHYVGRWRSGWAEREQARFINRLLPRDQLDAIITQNRNALRRIPTWITDDVYENSIFQYGLPREYRHLIDLEIGNEPTYADAMSVVARRLSHPIRYLEIGVSVGKTFWQAINTMKPSEAVGFDIENLSPVLAQKLEVLSSESWQGPADSMRHALSIDSTYRLTDSTTSIRYLAADVFDDSAWQRLANGSFNLVFSDAFHSPEALEYEFLKMMEYNVLDPREFIIVYDDLLAPMRAAFDRIGGRICQRYNIPSTNQFILPLKGWLGQNYTFHPVGMILNVPRAVP